MFSSACCVTGPQSSVTSILFLARYKIALSNPSFTGIHIWGRRSGQQTRTHIASVIHPPWWKPIIHETKLHTLTVLTIMVKFCPCSCVTSNNPWKIKGWSLFLSRVLNLDSHKKASKVLTRLYHQYSQFLCKYITGSRSPPHLLYQFLKSSRKEQMCLNWSRPHVLDPRFRLSDFY